MINKWRIVIDCKFILIILLVTAALLNKTAASIIVCVLKNFTLSEFLLIHFKNSFNCDIILTYNSF